MAHPFSFFVDFISGEERHALTALSQSMRVRFWISDILERRLDQRGVEVFLLTVYADSLDHATQLRKGIARFRFRGMGRAQG